MSHVQVVRRIISSTIFDWQLTMKIGLGRELGLLLTVLLVFGVVALYWRHGAKVAPSGLNSANAGQNSERVHGGQESERLRELLPEDREPLAVSRSVLSPSQLSAIALEKRLVRGELHHSHPLVREYAARHVSGNIGHSKRNWQAILCGFASPEELEGALESKDVNLVHLRGQLQYLAEQSKSASELCGYYLDKSWGNPSRVEAWDGAPSHDSADWESDNIGAAADSCNFSSVTSTSVGPLKFRLHLVSSDYPELEDTLSMVASLREEFWSTMRGLQKH
jgi:hypothetical protein